MTKLQLDLLETVLPESEIGWGEDVSDGTKGVEHGYVRVTPSSR